MLARKYRLKTNTNGETALLNNKGEIVSLWWDFIYTHGLNEASGLHYAVRRNDQKMAIFSLSNFKKPISQWWDFVYSGGLLDGISAVYAVRDEEEGCALFHRDNPNKPISDWGIEYSSSGVVIGEFEYSLVKHNYIIQLVIHRKNVG